MLLPPLDVYLLALGLTLVVEVPVAVALAGREKRWKMALDAPLLNLFSHPLATLAFFFGGLPLALEADVSPLWAFAVVEAGVIAVEALGFWLLTGLSAARATLISLAANGLTIALSFAMRDLIALLLR